MRRGIVRAAAVAILTAVGALVASREALARGSVPRVGDRADANDPNGASSTANGANATGATATEDDAALRETGFYAGLRAGYAAPFGYIAGNGLRGIVSGVIPIGAQAGVFLTPHLYIGGYFSFGFGLDTGTCPDAQDVNTSCTTTVIRFGAESEYHFLPLTRVDPYLGGGIGYDILNLTSADNDTGEATSQSVHGFDLHLLGGVDFKPLRYLGIGPYTEISFGHYQTETGSATEIHGYWTIGIRGRTGF